MNYQKRVIGARHAPGTKTTGAGNPIEIIFEVGFLLLFPFLFLDDGEYFFKLWSN